MKPLQGIDASYHNATESLPISVDFAIVRLSFGMPDGRTLPDESAERHLERLSRARVPVLAAYHYLSTAKGAATGEDQADVFLARDLRHEAAGDDAVRAGVDDRGAVQPAQDAGERRARLGRRRALRGGEGSAGRRAGLCERARRAARGADRVGARRPARRAVRTRDCAAGAGPMAWASSASRTCSAFASASE